VEELPLFFLCATACNFSRVLAIVYRCLTSYYTGKENTIT